MTRPRGLLLAAITLLIVVAWPVVSAFVAAAGDGGLDPAQLLKPLGDSWPTYSGDYSGRRYSLLTQIDQSNVRHLTLAWVARMSGGPGGGGRGGPAPDAAPTIVGGEGTGDVTVAGATTLKGAILMVNGVLYVTAPDNVWAFDAHDGHELWHYFWKTKGGTHIGNRGAAMWGNYLYFVTPDDYFVSIDARTGRERWHKEAASCNRSTRKPGACSGSSILCR
jgi:alcohol dehydrogenase (cytochrome c)